ncbi:tRNA (adenosine(37)-N6)-threonylcarbamoyltransferase complex dimerization subunit type 1 TsaB [Gilvimarinus sp. SDUM040013]|nr:tRNA (adenosine(37)-N6)-threonylcarbamoyltransferase complex dimerization subunit type 1 TsaB [Gilvimarinus sp. SDUM040013]MDO3385101.1 tRNA (adenosine(37)-N6)-threonylcarbamoyltransferase complex dimerization subunit type 1 TsaB [Gilvimarinus sp. SDUM040013]
MPTILSLDTSTEACSVAMLMQDGKIYEHFEVAAKSHTQRILPMIDDLLSECGMELASLDAIAFSAGPGSFTGIRIGMGVVQGLAFAGALPVIPVCTLQAQALPAGKVNPGTPVLSALDARMGEVYYGVYDYDLVNSRLRIVQAPSVCAPAALSVPCGCAAENVVGVGQGFTVDDMATYASRFDASATPRASAVAELAERAWARGEAEDVRSVEPKYIRDTVTWKKRERIRT